MKFDTKKLLKWTPVVCAGVIATVKAIMEQKEDDQIDDMEERKGKIEKKEDT